MNHPNILLIHADQHRADCLGCMGNPDVKTPQIDALAADGVRHTRHYTVYPVCTPSRYSMLSGLYPHQHTGWTNVSSIPSHTRTFPKMLKQAGYHTAAVGKMHMSPTYLDVGFDELILAEQCGVGRYEDEYHEMLADKGKIDAVDVRDQVLEVRAHASADYFASFGAEESDLPLSEYSTEWITEQALSEIQNWNHEGGRFLMVGYVKPHHPFDPPAPYSTMYDPDKLTLLPDFTAENLPVDYARNPGYFDMKTLTEPALRKAMALYYGCITEIDDGVGRLVAALKEAGLYENTMIIYTSDHGEFLGCHHMLLKGNHLYEPLAKIPLIIKYPENTHAGIVDEGLSENIDLAPTILRVANAQIPYEMSKIYLNEGVSRPFAFSEGDYGAGKSDRCFHYMIRDERFKLILTGSFEKGLLFDLQKDPNELDNLFDHPAHAAVRAHLSKELASYLIFCAQTTNCHEPNADVLVDKEITDARSFKVRTLIKEKTGILPAGNE